MPRLVKLSFKKTAKGKYGSYIVHIPRDVVEELKLKPGDYLDLSVEEGKIVLTPVKIERRTA